MERRLDNVEQQLDKLEDKVDKLDDKSNNIVKNLHDHANYEIERDNVWHENITKQLAALDKSLELSQSLDANEIKNIKEKLQLLTAGSLEHAKYDENMLKEISKQVKAIDERVTWNKYSIIILVIIDLLTTKSSPILLELIKSSLKAP